MTIGMSRALANWRWTEEKKKREIPNLEIGSRMEGYINAQLTAGSQDA